MNQKLIDKLKNREEEGTMRSLSLLRDKIDFFSNDYLGLSKIIIPTKTSGGSTGSRLISGNSEAAEHCEKILADWFRTEGALIFNSGYDANLGLFSSVPQKGDTVLYDDQIHASIRDGIRLSFATNHSFRHNDLEDLKNKLTNASGTVYVAIESLYSMDGDIAPLGKIHALCNEVGASLIVDEAHACGVFGDHGRGIVDCLSDASSVFARVITFGKAYGYHGAAILGSKDLKNYLINFARSFIYTTALPPESYKQIEARVTHKSIPEKQRELQKKIQHFLSLFPGGTFISEKNSPIQIMRFGEVQKAIEIANKLFKNGFAVKPIFSPTVAVGDEG
ncbi:MAG: aminotransferase class I/II-fold pyridoxal phosphate-dependent enzyme, partial [Bacteroidota bacterium]